MIVYGRNAVREALRGPRQVRTVWATKGAAKEFPRAVPASADQIAARAGSDGHQGVCADVEEYRYADAGGSCARRTRCWWRSTRSPTRRTWARSAARPSARARRA